MENILKYLSWRGDITFEERSFNELDALVCALIGYIEWDTVVYKDAVSLKAACITYCNIHTKESMYETYAYSPMLVDLVYILQNTKRYKDVALKNYISIVDVKKDLQFAGVTILLPNNALYVSYRGTDSSILGWKEDFEMLYKNSISSQQLALDYLQETYYTYFNKTKVKKITTFFTRRKPYTVYVGGHSKGGNIAMYSAICCQDIHPYITKVYSFDGPGFKESFYQQHDYLMIIERIVNYVPDSSIIGRILEHKENYSIFNGYTSGLQQHDAFYWKTGIDTFKQAKGFSKDSDRVKVSIENVLATKSDQEKETLILFVFKILEDMKIHSITDFTEVGLKSAILGIKELSTMNQEERKFFFEFTKLLFTQTKSILSVITNQTSKDSSEKVF